MKKNTLVAILVLSAMVICASCHKEEEYRSVVIEGLTIDNYPKVDGSTSTTPLNTLIACKLLGIGYEWVQNLSSGGTWGIEPKLSGSSKEKFEEQVKTSQTHRLFINLIDGETDLILSARKMSPDEKIYADAAGVSLIETPIALDAFIFIVHPHNQIKSLTTKQIQDIYTGGITNWNEVGGSNAEIKPYIRNPNSGSQELMDLLVMKDLDSDYYKRFPISDEVVIFTMWGAFEEVSRDKNSLCYTVYYYKEQMIRKEGFVKSIAIDGIYPDKNTIKNRQYPYTTDVYAIIRSDLDKSSMAYKIYELMQAEEGKQIINESGYVTD